MGDSAGYITRSQHIQPLERARTGRKREVRRSYLRETELEEIYREGEKAVQVKGNKIKCRKMKYVHICDRL